MEYEWTSNTWHNNDECIEYLLRESSPANVLVLPGDLEDEEYEDDYECLCLGELFESWGPDNENGNEIEFGPTCKLCDKMIIADRKVLIFRGTSYWIFFEGEASEDEDWGVLQCSYCFDFFHRNKCSLSMTNYSYFEAQKNRSWACPKCVPVFIPYVKTGIKKFDSNHFLEKLFSLLSKIRNVLIVEYNIERVTHHEHKFHLACEFIFDTG